MAVVNPTTRANYEPNSWPSASGGPREDPERGFRTTPTSDIGPKRRLRPESFADHYSQARQFFISQTGVEQQHIIDSFVFELSKCERVDIRERMVAGLRNVHEKLAHGVARGLGLVAVPEPLEAAREPVEDLGESPALSILQNGPTNFAGRKVGILLSDGSDAQVLADLQSTAAAGHITLELIAPAVGGVDLSDGTHVAADQQIQGAPSVLYDAVVLLASYEGAVALAHSPAARDFVSDAFAHYKFIGLTKDSDDLVRAAGLEPLRDDGFLELGEGANSAAAFFESCTALRFWQRQAAS
jgi:catalase